MAHRFRNETTNKKITQNVSCWGFFKDLLVSWTSSSNHHPAGGVFTQLPKDQSTTPDQHSNFLLLKIFESIVHPTLHDVFTKFIWRSKLKSETLRMFIFRQASAPSNTDYKKIFDKGQRDKINTDPSCIRFDTSLYYKSLLLTAQYNHELNANQTLSDELTDKLKELKDIRNHLLHDLLIVPKGEVQNYAQALKFLMRDILDLTGNIFGCTADTIIQNGSVQTSIDEILISQHSMMNCYCQCVITHVSILAFVASTAMLLHAIIRK